MSPIGPYFQLNSPNNFSANRSVVFKSLYVIVLHIGKTFEDHVFQSNQLGSRVHIWTPERLEQWYGDRRDFLAILPSHATRASLSPRARLAFASVLLKYAKNYACSADYVALSIVATFLSPRGLAEKCDKTLWLRRQFFRKISSATTQHRDQALRPSGGAQGREHRSIDAHSADFAKTYYHPSPVHIMRKKTCFWRPCTYRPLHLPLHWRNLVPRVSHLTA